MSVATEISRLQTAKSDIKTAIEAKGVEVPSSAKIDVYDDYISQISTGGFPVSPGIYACYEDGSLKSYAEADTNALGVAVITSDCAFGISKDATIQKQPTLNRNGLPIYSNKQDAVLDFDGEHNTKRIFCSSGNTNRSEYYTFNKGNYRGYIGSAGEWQTYFDNREEVDAMMTKIGGNPIVSDPTRQEYSGQQNQVRWRNDYVYTENSTASSPQVLTYPSDGVSSVGNGIQTSTFYSSSAPYMVFQKGTVYQFVGQGDNIPHEAIIIAEVKYKMNPSMTSTMTGYFITFPYVNNYVTTDGIHDGATNLIQSSVRAFFDLRDWMSNN